MVSDTPNLDFSFPWMNAAGSLGFTPEAHGDVSLQGFGAFVTNPISVRARKAAQGERLLEFPGGVLMHTGHPNPGLRTTTRSNANSWKRSSLPIIIHLLAAEPKQLRTALLRIEELENVIAIELGLEPETSAAAALQVFKSATGELPLIAQVPIGQVEELGDLAMQAGASAISLGAPRGSLSSGDGKLVSGRLYGTAIYPLALNAAALLAKQGIPVIAAGGVDTRERGQAMLDAGAIAVQLDIGLWK